MTVGELSDKLLKFGNRDAEISIGCNTDYGNCLVARVGELENNVLMCDYPEYCSDYFTPDSEM